jgi:uncharacterized delta-60 repeat protein
MVDGDTVARQLIRLEGKMRVRFVTIVFVLFFLVACSSSKPSLQPEPSEQPLFTDADLDNATIQKLTTASVEVASEVNTTNGAEVDNSADSVETGDITAQAVLPGATGVIAYIRYTPTATNPYNIILFDQATDVRTVVYSGKREIDSVAVDSLGTKVVFSSRQTTALTTDFEVYQLVLNPKTVTTLTNNTSDDTNVSMSGDAGTIAWEGLSSTTATRQVQWLDTAISTLNSLNSSTNDTMPSVSGDGDYLAFIRTPTSGPNVVQVYQLSTSTLTNVYSNNAVKRHPSVSDTGRKVAWTEVGTTTTRVYVKDTATGVRTSVVANTGGVEHAHLRKDGRFLTYGLLQNGKWQLYTRNLTTNTAVKGVGSTTADAKGMFWAVVLPGSLDTTFGIGGKVTTNIYPNTNYFEDYTRDVVIDNNGKIVVLGYSSSLNETNLVVVRYNPDGSLDTSLDGDGKLTPAPFTQDGRFGSFTLGNAVAIDSNNKIIVVGTTIGAPVWSDAAYDIFVARYNPDGSPDQTFDEDGVVITDIAFRDYGNAVIIDDTGKIMVAGSSQANGSRDDVAVLRYNEDGSLDTSFNSNGIVITSISDYADVVSAVAIDSNDKIVVIGNSNSIPMAVRYHPNGLLDADAPNYVGFGGDGIVLASFFGQNAFAQSGTVDSDDNVVITGRLADVNNVGNGGIILVRYTSNGSLDTTFDGDGLVTTIVGTVNDQGRDVIIDDSDKIIVAGVANTAPPTVVSNVDFVVLRYNTDGSLDTNFGEDGKVTTDVGFSQPQLPGTSQDDISSAVVTDGNGRIVVAGYSYRNNVNRYDFSVARYNP